MSAVLTESNNSHLLLKTAAISLFVTLSTIMIIRVILPSLFSLDETAREVYFSRVTVVYVFGTIFVIPGAIKRLKEWSFGKTLLILWACSTVSTFIMALSNIIDL